VKFTIRGPAGSAGHPREFVRATSDFCVAILCARLKRPRAAWRRRRAISVVPRASTEETAGAAPRPTPRPGFGFSVVAAGRSPEHANILTPDLKRQLLSSSRKDHGDDLALRPAAPARCRSALPNTAWCATIPLQARLTRPTRTRSEVILLFDIERSESETRTRDVCGLKIPRLLRRLRLDVLWSSSCFQDPPIP
jgi:hypothetical protein